MLSERPVDGSWRVIAMSSLSLIFIDLIVVLWLLFVLENLFAMICLVSSRRLLSIGGAWILLGLLQMVEVRNVLFLPI